ncbi:MAG: hypothetical protein ABSH28_13520, partial [Acidobacteriota bacterium]
MKTIFTIFPQASPLKFTCFTPLCAAQREFCSRYVLRPIRFYGSQRSEFTWKCKFFDLRAT